MTELLYTPTKYSFARAKPAVAANPVRLRSPPKILYHISANIVLLLLILSIPKLMYLFSIFNNYPTPPLFQCQDCVYRLTLTSCLFCLRCWRHMNLNAILFHKLTKL